MMIDWGVALQIFYIGFGGVFVCLLILQLMTILTSKIVIRIEKSTNDES